MDKKIIGTVIVFSLIILILGTVIVSSLEQKNKQIEKTIKIPPQTSIVYYYGETCPHCLEVKKWMEENKVEEKIKIVKKEVWGDRQNALEMEAVAKKCQLDISTIGVPFLYADGKCYIGTPAVIGVLENKIK